MVICDILNNTQEDMNEENVAKTGQFSILISPPPPPPCLQNLGLLSLKINELL